MDLNYLKFESVHRCEVFIYSCLHHETPRNVLDVLLGRALRPTALYRTANDIEARHQPRAQSIQRELQQIQRELAELEGARRALADQLQQQQRAHAALQEEVSGLRATRLALFDTQREASTLRVQPATTQQQLRAVVSRRSHVTTLPFLAPAQSRDQRTRAQLREEIRWKTRSARVSIKICIYDFTEEEEEVSR